MTRSTLLITLIALVLASCGGEEKKQHYTPWGEPVDEEGNVVEQVDSEKSSGKGFTLHDIKNAGEMIMLVVSGPDTYYDYHGHGMGLQYLLCSKFAQKVGVSLRVDMCKDSTEVMKRLHDGEGDIAVFSDFKDWQLADNKSELAKELKSWYKPEILEKTKKELHQILTYGLVKRHVYPFMLNRSTGTISRYDNFFRQYASIARLDWTLLAAQCYQESCFDPNAKSWAGAGGLMQIMPATADHLGLARSEINQPGPSIQAAARYMAELQQKFADVPARSERICFALASYNGGYSHVRDAMALAKKYGANPQRWDDVKQYILRLQDAKYYRDPVVRNGYMRGSETAGYVDKILERWSMYGHATHSKGTINYTPQPAKRKNKWS